jgi:hypothetical protein
VGLGRRLGPLQQRVPGSIPAPPQGRPARPRPLFPRRPVLRCRAAGHPLHLFQSAASRATAHLFFPSTSGHRPGSKFCNVLVAAASFAASECLLGQPLCVCVLCLSKSKTSWSAILHQDNFFQGHHDGILLLRGMVPSECCDEHKKFRTDAFDGLTRCHARLIDMDQRTPVAIQFSTNKRRRNFKASFTDPKSETSLHLLRLRTRIRRPLSNPMP